MNFPSASGRKPSRVIAVTIRTFAISVYRYPLPQKRKREGEKKYETKSGPRLSADDVMRRNKLHEYQNSYATAMKPFGLQRGIVGSTARHQANSDYYRQQVI